MDRIREIAKKIEMTDTSIKKLELTAWERTILQQLLKKRIDEKAEKQMQKPHRCEEPDSDT